MQKGLGDKLKEMQDGMQQGKNPKQMGKDFADAVQKQAAMREALRKMKEKMSQKDKDASGIDDLMQKMDDVEKDLVLEKIITRNIKTT
jgi:hypothetical protein